MDERVVPAIKAPPPKRDNPLTRSVAGLIGIGFLALVGLACLASMPWTLAPATGEGDQAAVPRYNAGTPRASRLPPAWWPHDAEDIRRLNRLVPPDVAARIAAAHSLTPDELLDRTRGPAARALAEHHPTFLLGTDQLGRSLLVRCLTGGGISLSVGIAAALVSVAIGTVYGTVAAYAGGRIDAVMMRMVDILYGLPYILVVVLIAVAVDAAVDRFAGGRLSSGTLHLIGVGTLLVAIGGVSWLTMARVVRGQVLSLRNQPFMEAARIIGVPWRRQFTRHLLPNLGGPIIVYATLTVPQAILQESFLSFLGIGVRPPLPSWGNLAADGLSELNPYESHWWLLLFPSLLLALTLLALNFVGEGLREALDPRQARS